MKIELKNISKSFNDKEVLKDISYTFTSPNLYCILSPSGEGKSTLLSILGLLDSPSSGELLYDDELVDPKDETNFISKHISFTFQDYNLFENLTVYENLSLFEADREKLTSLLKEFKLDISLDSKVKYLSGGERQRLSIIRSLLKGGDVFLFDEPSGNLDEVNAYLVFDLIKEVSKTKLCIVVTHNTLLAYQYGDHILKLVNHNLVDSGSSSNILTLDIKNRGLEAFDELYDAACSKPGGITFFIDEKEVNVTSENALKIFNDIYSENKDQTVEIRFRNTEKISADETAQNIEDKNENRPNSRFFLSYFKNNLFRKGSRLALFSILFFVFFVGVSAFSNFVYIGDIGTKEVEILTESEIEYSPLMIVNANGTGYEYGGNLIKSLDDSYVYMFEKDSQCYYSYNVTSSTLARGTVNIPIYLVSSDFIYQGEEYHIDKGEIMMSRTLKEWYLDNIKFQYDNNTGYFDSGIYGYGYDEDKDYYYDLLTSNYEFYDVLFPISSTTTFVPEDIEIDINYRKNLDTLVAFIEKDYFIESIYSNAIENDSNVSLDNNIILDIYADGRNPRVEQYSNQGLIYGRAAESNNEVVINYWSISVQLDTILASASPEELVGLSIPIEDISLTDTDYRHNYYDITDEITIVGAIYEENGSDLYVNSDVFKTLISDELYNFTPYLFVKGSEAEFNRLSKIRIYSSESTVSPLVKYQTDTVKDFMGLWITLLCVCIGLLILISVLNGIYFIRDKYHDIAILKSLAASNKKIFAVFYLSILIPVLFGLVVSLILIAPISIGINGAFGVYFSSTSAVIYSLYSINWLAIVLPIGIAAIVPIVVALCFVRKIASKKPFESLKEYKE